MLAMGDVRGTGSDWWMSKSQYLRVQSCEKGPKVSGRRRGGRGPTEKWPITEKGEREREHNDVFCVYTAHIAPADGRERATECSALLSPWWLANNICQRGPPPLHLLLAKRKKKKGL